MKSGDAGARRALASDGRGTYRPARV